MIESMKFWDVSFFLSLVLIFISCLKNTKKYYDIVLHFRELSTMKILQIKNRF